MRPRRFAPAAPLLTASCLLLACLLLTACETASTTTQPVVVVPWRGDRAAVAAAIDARVAAVETLAAECRLTFHRRDGDTVGLNGAVVARLPDHLRIRAWKLGNAVFDLTVRPDGVWLWNAKRASEATEKLLSSELLAGRWAEVWPLLVRLLRDPESTYADHGPQTFLVRRALEDGAVLEAVVNGARETVEQYRLIEADGTVAGTLTLSDPVEIGGAEWPTVWRADGEAGKIDVELEDLVLDESLPEAAFDPPKRATKQEAPPPTRG